MGPQNNFWQFDFFSKKCFLAIWKSSSSRSQKSKSEVPHVIPWFLKNSQSSKNRLICTAISDHVIHVMIPKTVSNDSQEVSTMCDSNIFLKFRNLRILCQMVIQDFLKSRGLIEISDSNFSDQLNELFLMAEK